MNIHLVAGARPNFVKAAPLLRVLEKYRKFNVKFINTGQHYDKILSDSIIEDLEIRKPDINLSVGSGCHNEQISSVLYKYNAYLKKNKPDLVFVFGDVNSTLAASLAAKTMGIKVAHVEAGLRCYDDDMQEEINRRITDSISDYLFTPSLNENRNLKKENISNKIFFVGNIMIDSLTFFYKKNKFCKPKYPDYKFLFTLHRPENVDNKVKLTEVIKKIEKWSTISKFLFPVHPRTRKNLIKYRLYSKLKLIKNIKVVGPLSYKEFLIQLRNSDCIITDSGGVQEESSFLGIPCLTLRKNTERPITLTKGTNHLCNLESISPMLKKVKKKQIKIPKWDGKTSQRIFNILKKIYKI